MASEVLYLSRADVEKQPARTTAEQRTMSMQLGLAIADMVTAIRIYEQACARGIGTRLPL